MRTTGENDAFKDRGSFYTCNGHFKRLLLRRSLAPIKCFAGLSVRNVVKDNFNVIEDIIGTTGYTHHLGSIYIVEVT